MLFCSSALARTDNVDSSLAIIAFMYADLPILLRLRTAVMATKSRHVSEVMATVQVSVVAEEKRGADPFLELGLYNAKHVKSNYSEDET